MRTNKKQIIVCVLFCILMIIFCSACGETVSDDKNVDSTSESINTELLTNEDISEIEEIEQTTEMGKFSNTYVTRFGKLNEVTFPSFAFDYPDNWKVINKEVTSESEIVELTNDDGMIIRYQYITPEYAYGQSRITAETEITKAADSKFILGFAQTTDYSDLGEFVVAKIQAKSYVQYFPGDEREPEQLGSDSDESCYYYALKPKSECGTDTIDANFLTAFWYDGLLEFEVDISEKISSDEEQEVIDIISSFRVAGSEDVTTEDRSKPDDDLIYEALQNGDFSYFAGTYMPCEIYHDWYGGGNRLPNLILQEDGVITGGLVYGTYPDTKPISVTRNEDGSYLCQVTYNNDENQQYFLIYPEGIVGKNPYSDNRSFLLDTVYIQYMSFDGGVMDIIYYKVED